MSQGNQDSDDFEDMSEYLQTFCDETEEQLDDLVETMLLLEKSSTDTEGLNEAFRLIHSIKGASGLMGLEQITILTHHLESRFERFRSGIDQIDEPTMNLVLKSVDFLRQSVDRLRADEPLGSPMELLGELRQLEEEGHRENEKIVQGSSSSQEDAPEAISNDSSSPSESAEQSAPALDPQTEPSQSDAATVSPDAGPEVASDAYMLTVDFRPEIPLADLKAQLILNRLSTLGSVLSHAPPVDSIADEVALTSFRVWIRSEESEDRLTSAADVDGVESVSIVFGKGVEMPIEDDAEESGQPKDTPVEKASEAPRQAPGLTEAVGQADAAVGDERIALNPAVAAEEQASPARENGEKASISAQAISAETPRVALVDPAALSAAQSSVRSDSDAHAESVDATDSQTEPTSDPQPSPEPSAAAKPTAQVAAKTSETMRVGIDRLDKLMNLTGELVVNRARFVQISGDVSPELRKAGTLNRVREFCDSLRLIIEGLEHGGELLDREKLVSRLRSGLEVLDQHSETWERDRESVDQFGDAIDQLSRVSQGLQKGVLDTRMVPVGPLFNRFKRVTRDLSKERGKKVDLIIRGEKTELDKRMIDELGDPLVHLVRNSIDHGMESPEDRMSAGKPETGSITLEATHRGNNVYISVQDNGRGIDDVKIRAKLVGNGVLSQAAADELSRDQALEYIWHPGFSTAAEITDVSGRGVGMDVVQDRIRRLNGNVEVQSEPGDGTRFTVRLPLTLAIINCLLVRLRSVVFAISIEDVREIVSLSGNDVVDVLGKQTFELRGEFIPLVGIGDLFEWREPEDLKTVSDAEAQGGGVHVVVMQSGGKTMGLRVDGLMGSQDIVVKSLSDNFMDIRGLSGASILGDGSVCLMLDVATIFYMSSQGAGGHQSIGDGTTGV